MGIFDIFFHKAEKKPAYKSNNALLQTRRSSVEKLSTETEKLEAQRKEEELLEKIRKGIEESRNIRKEYKCSAVDIIKYANMRADKLDEKVETNKNYHHKEKSAEGFYVQYTKGAFVVPI